MTKIVIGKDNINIHLYWDEELILNEKSISIKRNWKVYYNISDSWKQYKTSIMIPESRLKTLEDLILYVINEAKKDNSWISRSIVLGKNLEVLHILIDY